jgi:hypothetical protein
VEIILRENGGLGNQLFQYAALRYYAKRYDAKMRIAVRPALYAHFLGYPRPCLLQHFSISVPMQERSLSDRLTLTGKPWLQAAFAPLNRAFGIQIFTEHHTNRYLFSPELPLRRGTRKLYLSGWWHNYIMVEQLADELRREFTFKEPAQGKNQEVLEQIKRTRNPVSLHVRGGDSIITETDRVPLLGQYYWDAISTFKRRLADPTFFVFSDDMAFVKQFLPRDTRMVLIEHNDDYMAHEDMRLMSSCHHHIIANSTFSWWGAWLNPRPDKMVIAPRQWYGTVDSYYPELMPQSWILAEVACTPEQKMDPSLLLR